MILLICNLIISSVLTGVIIMTQIVNYPLFKYVKNDFPKFHQKYVKLIGFSIESPQNIIIRIGRSI